MQKLFSNDRNLTIGLLFISLIVSFNYLFFVYPLHHSLIVEMHDSILKGSALSPVKHRLLFPWLVEIVKPVFENTIGKSHSFSFSFFLVMAASYFLSFFASFRLFNLFHSKKTSLLLCLLFGFSLIISHYKHYYNPWSMIEPGLFSLGFIYAYQNKKTSFLVILLLAILNRETGVFLSIAYVLTNHSALDIIKKPKLIFKNTFGLICIIFSVTSYILIRKITGETQHSVILSETFAQNTTPFNLILAFICYSLYFHVYLLLKFRFSELPAFLKNQLPILMVCSVFILTFGIWLEIRMFNERIAIIVYNFYDQVNNRIMAPI